MKCGRCWKDGHPGNRCLKKGAVPGEIRQPAPRVAGSEPLFDELLTGPYPVLPPHMLKDMPDVTTCFLERDATHDTEVEALSQAIIVRALHWEGDLMADQVAEFATSTNLVKLNEIAVASFNGSACLIHLPPQLASATFLAAIPQHIWNLGLDFQQWSPYDEAEKLVHEFKVLIRLVGVHVHHWRERYIIRAVSSFGLYLGIISPPHSADYSAWSMVVATDKLERIPHRVEMIVGGLKRYIRVLPIKWIRAPIYSEVDMPKRPPKFHRPRPPSPNCSNSSGNSIYHDEDEVLHIPRWMVLQVCKDRDPDTLPEDLKEYLNNLPPGESIEGGLEVVA